MREKQKEIEDRDRSRVRQEKRVTKKKGGRKKIIKVQI